MRLNHILNENDENDDNEDDDKKIATKGKGKKVAKKKVAAKKVAAKKVAAKKKPTLFVNPPASGADKSPPKLQGLQSLPHEKRKKYATDVDYEIIQATKILRSKGYPDSVLDSAKKSAASLKAKIMNDKAIKASTIEKDLRLLSDRYHESFADHKRNVESGRTVKKNFNAKSTAVKPTAEKVAQEKRALANNRANAETREKNVADAEARFKKAGLTKSKDRGGSGLTDKRKIENRESKKNRYSTSNTLGESAEVDVKKRLADSRKSSIAEVKAYGEKLKKGLDEKSLSQLRTYIDKVASDLVEFPDSVEGNAKTIASFKKRADYIASLSK